MMFPLDLTADDSKNYHDAAESFIEAMNSDRKVKHVLGTGHKLPEAIGFDGYAFVIERV